LLFVQIAKMFAKGIAFGSIVAVYCTDQYLVIHGTGKPNHNNTVAYIPRSPGGGGGYTTACVTRPYSGQFFSFKIALYPSLLPTASLTNNVAEFPANSMLTGIPLPEAGTRFIQNQI
jgi:hypothetical protein